MYCSKCGGHLSVSLSGTLGVEISTMHRGKFSKIGNAHIRDELEDCLRNNHSLVTVHIDYLICVDCFDLFHVPKWMWEAFVQPHVDLA